MLSVRIVSLALEKGILEGFELIRGGRTPSVQDDRGISEAAPDD